MCEKCKDAFRQLGNRSPNKFTISRPQWPQDPEPIEESETGKGSWLDILIRYLIAWGVGAHLLIGYLIIEHIFFR